MTEPSDTEIAAKLLPPENWPDFASGAGTVWTGRRKAIAAALSQARLAGEKKGREEMRERAAKAAGWFTCGHYRESECNVPCTETGSQIAKAIRALDAGTEKP